MTQTASILWAVLATGIGIFLNTINGIVMRNAREIVVLAKELAVQRDTWRELYDKACADLDAIHYARHNSAKHARACQLTKQREAIAARTAELQQNISDRTSKDDRMAA